jgi:hypothetical protein
MQTFSFRALRGSRARHRLALAGCTSSLFLAATAPAAFGAPVSAELRVEADGKALAPGHRLINGTARVETFRSCGGSGNSIRIPGPTALGIVEYGEKIYSTVNPVGVSDEFDFGLFVCQIDVFRGDLTKFWLYKVNRKSPTVGGEQFALKRGDKVLWFFQDTVKKINTGDELVLKAPARAQAGQPFTVTVFAFNQNGTRRVVSGANIVGEASAVTNAQGQAQITGTENEFLTIKARHGGDIPSERVHVCVNATLSRCQPAPPERIIGTRGPDSITGTAAADLVVARGGNDRINVRGTIRDRVRCGTGWDRVLAGSNDIVAQDCNVVIRP